MKLTVQHIKSIFQKMGAAGFLIASTVVVNAGNYGLNLILGRYLGPGDFSEANVLATIVMILSFVAVGLQLSVTKFIAIYDAESQNEVSENLIAYLWSTTRRFSLITMIALLLLTYQIQDFLSFESALPLALIFISIPFYLLMSIGRGFYQGKQAFKKLAWSYLIEMIARVLITVLALTIAGNQGINSELIAFGFFSSFIATFLFTRLKANVVSWEMPFKEELIRFLSIIGIYELSQVLINHSDIILVKHYFEPEQAGLYASIALIGKVVFFATWTIVTLLFPKVIEKEKKGEDHKSLFWYALTLVASVGLILTLICGLFNEAIINFLYGQEYLASAHLLALYALATTCFACANVFAYYHLSLNNYTPVFISLLIGCLQILTILLFHNSLDTIIHIQITLMTLLLVAMVSYHMSLQWNTEHSTTPATVFINN